MAEHLKSKRKRSTVIGITAVVFFVLMILPATLGIVYYKTYDSFTKQTIDQQQSLVQLGTDALKIKLDNLVGIATSIASAPDVVAFAQKNQWENIAASARDLQNDVTYYDSFIDRVVVYDASGTQQAAYPELVGGIGTSAATSTWYTALTTGGQSSSLSNVKKRITIPRIQVVNIGVPIKGKNGITGFVVLQIPTDHFLEFGENLPLGAYGFAYVVDAAGNLVAHPKFFLDNGNVVNYSDVQSVAEVVSGKNGTDFISNRGTNEESVVTYSPVAGYGWGIVAQELSSEAFAVRDNILLGIELLIIFLTIIIILVTYVVFRSLNGRGIQAKK